MSFANKTGMVVFAVIVTGAVLIWWQRQNPAQAQVQAKIQLPSLSDFLGQFNKQYNAPAYGSTGTAAGGVGYAR